MQKLKLGVCYYPEQWPEEMWEADAAGMVACGITHVRIAEFAWSRMEPERGRYDWAWLDRAIAVLADAGLEIILGTPTAAPPRWLVNLYPDLVPVGADGRARIFGSRRHYCFSHQVFRAESARIVTAMATRYGQHPSVICWQTDNEYAGNDTALSYSPAALEAFRAWLGTRYGTIEELNRRWGNVFWSMEYAAFDEIDFPAGVVSLANPIHMLDFRRFSSDQIVSYNRMQVDILHALSPGRPVVHNFMGRFTLFDHHKMARDLDFVTWDNYPTGFLSRFGRSEEHRSTYLKSGDPDFQAFHHDLYRSMGNGRVWVMEHQAGPLNWAPANAIPAPGMIRCWTWESYAHGCDLVSYFRWRQVPYAQEQFHSGLHLPDNSPAPGFHEVRQVAGELAIIPELARAASSVALIFDYESVWTGEIARQGAQWDTFECVMDAYRALRRLGLSVDVLPPDIADLSAYALIVLPSLFTISPVLDKALAKARAPVIVGSRSGSKTEDLAVPVPLPPSGIAGLGRVKAHQVESLPPGYHVAAANAEGKVSRWREHVTGPSIVFHGADGHPIVVEDGRFQYLCGWPDDALWHEILKRVTAAANIEVLNLPGYVRRCATTAGDFYFNYGSEPFDLTTIGISGDFALDGVIVPPSGVSLRKA